MKTLAFLLAFALCCAAETFAGRWALESKGPEKKVFWLDVTGLSPVSGEFFGVTGGRLERLRDAEVNGVTLRFRVVREAVGEFRRMEGSAELQLTANALSGTVTSHGKSFSVRGWRSPPIQEFDDGSWKPSTPLTLLGDGLAHWQTYEGRDRDWSLRDGILSNRVPRAQLLVSRANYWNFRLKLDYRLPKGGNAGIGLRHHYELQLADDFGQPPDVHGNASLYSQIAPLSNKSRAPDNWQTIELTLIGRDLTVILNGAIVIDRQRIRGLSGLALDADETKPGPVSLQGDHGRIEYRNVEITSLVRK